MRANETYTKAKGPFSDRNRNVFINVQSSHKWWSTFGSTSSLPDLLGGIGRLVCESVSKTDLVSDHFDSKESRVSVEMLLTCHPSPSLATFAFRS